MRGRGVSLPALCWLSLWLLACGPDARDGVSGFDSTSSTSSTWARFPMPNSAVSGLPNTAKYEVVASAKGELVRDLVTGLVWQRAVADVSFDWARAEAHCAELSAGGFDDWRLPSRIELVSLLDDSRTNPAIDLGAFPTAPSEWHWSRSLGAGRKDAAWYVYFYFGYPDTDGVEVENRVRCVRGEPVSAESSGHYRLGDNSVVDLQTGLTWQRRPDGAPRSFDGAREHCEALVIDGERGFRVPSMKELETLVDDSRAEPAIDVAVFPGTPSSSFWSASSWAGSATLAWHVRFDTGSANYEAKDAEFQVRCVR